MTADGQTPGAARGGDIFATTRWTVVLAAGRSDTPEAGRALEELCRVYWFPLYAYARRTGLAPADAEDVTQSFFAHFLGGHYLEGLNSEKGRFRAFLLASFKHFLSNERDRASRQKRGGGVIHVPIDVEAAEMRYGQEPADHLTPDKVFDREWALALLDRVLARLEGEMQAEGRGRHFEALKGFLAAGVEPGTHAAAAAALGLSEGAARIAVHRLRRRYRELLRGEIAQTLTRPERVEDELNALFRAFER